MSTLVALSLCAALAAQAPPPPPPSPPASADAPPTKLLDVVEVTPRAQLRVRGELVGDRALGIEPLQTIVTHRARLGVAATAAERVSVLLEIQDVRAWGSELVPNGLPDDPTVYGAVTDSIDLHQGWVSILLDDVEIRAGRQEISLANERIIGALDWVQRARAFDALRILSRGSGALSWTTFFTVVRDKEVTPIDVADDPARGPFDDVVLGAAALEWKAAKELRWAPALVVDADLTSGRTRSTLGGRLDGALGAFQYDVDLYGQVTATGPDVRAAGLLGSRVSYGFDTFAHPRLGLVADVLTGSADGTGPIIAFDTLYATNHKFYGFQDLFLNLPLHTKGHGLVDTAAAVWLAEGPLSLTGFVHAFFPAAYDGPGVAMYGIEPELVAAWKPVPQLVVEAGASVFAPIGDALERGRSTAPWAYLQIGGQM